jgi:Ca-activated chloride channel family protein
MKTALGLASVLALGMAAGCGADYAEGTYGGNNGDYYESGNNGYQTQADAGTTADASGTPEEQDEDYQEGENYQEWVENDFIDTSTENTSTFAVDVDNGSYTVMRRDINSNNLPVPEGVRVEEYVNFFKYDYAQPREDMPFSINLEVAPSKFGEEGTQLLHIGLQGKQMSIEDMAPSNLVFLIDVSGSMSSGDKLAWVKESLYTLVDNLREQDSVGIVVYAGRDAVVLQPTPGSNKAQIRNAIEQLSSGGSTNGEAGIDRAYALAEQAKIEGGNNRVILMTDGDFNVGRTGDDLVDFVESKREKHITLTTVGFGRGNYNDASMEAFARKANGNYFYIDKLDEAARIFGRDLPSTLEVIAADVKVQVEFDSNTVERYRLIGYENRLLDNEDFDDDTKDAGEVGPGHTVTAVYELEMQSQLDAESFLSTVRLRYKDQFGDDSKLIERGIKASQMVETFEAASTDFRFSAAVTEYAEILRESKHSEGARFDDVISVATASAPSTDTEKLEFIELVRKAESLWNQ